VTVGQDVTYTISVVNNGLSPATGVTLVDTPPAGATFVSATGGVMPAGGVLTFNLGTLASGATATVSVVVQPTTAGTLTNMAVASAAESESSTSNNTASTSTTVTPTPTPTPTPSPTPTSTPTPTPTPTPTAAPPVTVLGVQLQSRKLSRKKKATVLVVSFSGALAPGPAGNLAEYHVGVLGRGKKAARKPPKSLPLTAAMYDPTAHTVTLVPRGKIAKAKLQLTITAAGVLDAQGRPLDGNRDGQPGGDFQATF
jgi:uncharacterized repeat protein (TIGR01451 family)